MNKSKPRRTSHLAERIKKCDFFLVIGTKRYFKSAIARLERDYTVEFKKDFYILLYPGATVPGWFLDEARETFILKYDPDASFDKQVRKLLKMGENDKINVTDGYEYD